MVLISSANHVISTAATKILDLLIWKCSTKVRYALVKADLIPQIITILNPLSLSFEEVKSTHNNIMTRIRSCLLLATPNGLASLEITDDDGLQAVHETILEQIVVPSEKYICHLCVNRFSIVDRDLYSGFILFLTHLLEISPSYQPTMDFVLNMPIVLTIPSSLTFFQNENTIWLFLNEMNDTQRNWNEKGGPQQQMWKTVHRMLRMEGIEDVIEEKLQNDKSDHGGRYIVDELIEWINQLGMNLRGR